MDPKEPTDIHAEIRKLLQENIELAKENRKVLHAIRRNQIFSTVWTVLIWVVALAIPVYLYHQYLEPVVSRFYPSASTTTPSFFVFPTSSEMQKLINSYKAQ